MVIIGRIEHTHPVAACNGEGLKLDSNVMGIPFLAHDERHVIRNSFRSEVPLWGHVVVCVVTDNTEKPLNTSLVSQAIDLWKN